MLLVIKSLESISALNHFLGDTVQSQSLILENKNYCVHGNTLFAFFFNVQTPAEWFSIAHFHM